MDRLNIGIVGCGNISGIYLQADRKFQVLKTVAVADLDPARASQQAEKYNVPRACGVDELLSASDVDIVVNLTPPHAHAAVGLAALENGKHVYNEKPLSVDLQQAGQMLELAEQKGLRVGCAPDTFLGAGLQTSRKLIDDGAIGRPIAATGFMMGHGPERWHPNPDFFYKPGGGPLFDMGPYYLTAMVSLLGPIRAVAGVTGMAMQQREIGSEARRGEKIDVETPTHIVGLLEFDSAAIGNLITSFDVWGAQLPRIEIYGTEGSLSVPDPNHFGGPVKIRRSGDSQFQP
ncbi:MAG: Gfo/Idh/MocA family protein, partial [Planctomycetota bacterium]